MRTQIEPEEQAMQPTSATSTDAMPRDVAVLLAGIGMAVIAGIVFLASVLSA
jgi:hypothetical protein